MKRVLIIGVVIGLCFFGMLGISKALIITEVGTAVNDVDTPFPTLTTLFSATHGSINDLDFYIDYEADTAAWDVTVILSNLGTGSSAVMWFDSASIGAQIFDDVNDTWFDDEASTAFVNAPLYTDTPDDFFDDIVPGSYTPATPLSVFDGEDIYGTWQLSIQNTGCCENEGDDLLGWSIRADVDTNAPIPEPATMILVGTGIAGLVGARYRRKKYFF